MRHEARAEDDGYRSPLAPGLRATEDAQRLAAEIGFACGRLATLALDPPGLYGEIAREPDLEEATWLAFLIAYIGPLEDEADPFAAIEAVRTPWGELPDLDGRAVGPRGAHDPRRGDDDPRRLRALRRSAPAARQLAFIADPAWTARAALRAHPRAARAAGPAPPRAL